MAITLSRPFGAYLHTAAIAAATAAQREKCFDAGGVVVHAVVCAIDKRLGILASEDAADAVSTGVAPMVGTPGRHLHEGVLQFLQRTQGAT